MTENTSQYINELRAVLLKSLEEAFMENESDKIIQYPDVSKAFTNGPHSNNFEIRAIDQDALKQWAADNGYQVSFLRDDVDSEYLEVGMPPVLFRKITSK